MFMRRTPYAWVEQSSASGQSIGSQALGNILDRAIYHISQPAFSGTRINEIWNNLDDIQLECAKINWDGYGAVPVSGDAIAEAKVLLKGFPLEYGIPDIVAEPSGSIGLAWSKGKDAALVLSLNGKEGLTYAGIIGEKKKYGVEKFTGKIPAFIEEEFLPHFSESQSAF